MREFARRERELPRGPDGERAAIAGRPARLTVGAVDDPAEREADRLADAVVRRLTGDSRSSLLAASADSRIRRTWAAVAAARPAEADHDRPIGLGGGAVDSRTASRIQRASGRGVPLPAQQRTRFESAFGANFGAVRLHADGEASSLNRRLGATAFTTGRDVFFRDGLPNVASQSGQHLLAHELAHVVQQQGTGGIRRRDDEPIRRRVGLEFETGVPVRNEAGGTLPYQDLVFKASSGLWKIVADSSNMEFVTEPFPEDRQGGEELLHTVNEIVEWICCAVREASRSGTVDDKGRVSVYVGDVEPSLGSTYLATDTTVTSGPDPGLSRVRMSLGGGINSVTASPQATGGVPLERIPALVKAIGTVKLKHLEGTPDFRGNKRSGEAIGLSGMKPTDAVMLRRGEKAAKSYADARSRRFRRDRNARLHGLLTLVYSYLFAGAEQTVVWEYSKIIAPLMARTDFATMYRLLTDEEKKHFVPTDILKHVGLNGDDRIFAKGYGTGKHVRRGPRRSAWLQSIVDGPVDLMSRDGGRSVTEGHSGSSSSMGAMHEADPGVAGASLVVLELRRLPKRQPAPMWVATAEVLFRLFRQLSNPHDAKRPEAAQAEGQKTKGQT